MADFMKQIYKEIDRLKPELARTLAELCAIPAIAPKSGGTGEMKKARFIETLIREIGFDSVRWYNVPDKNADGGRRPNLVALKKGMSRKTLWLIVHSDVVPPGEPTLWKTDPFRPVIRNGKVIGRGTEDNGQDIIAALYAVKALNSCALVPYYTLKIAIVADEETGSEYGLRFLLRKKLFTPGDLVIVPDYGTPAGNAIEIAEKSLLWLRVTTTGKQVHASQPQHGLNAFRAGMQFALEADTILHRRFRLRDKLFSPQSSTFEPTKKEPNVPNINTVPGKDVFYIDCRILPRYTIQSVLENLKNVAKKTAQKTGAKIKIETVQSSETPPTDPKAEIVTVLKRAIKHVIGLNPKTIGIGGGTCAAHIRRAGIPVAVWSKFDQVAHQPNEYARIENIVTNAKVYATVLCNTMTNI